MEKIDDKYPQFIRMDEEKKKNYLDPLTSLPASLFYKKEDGEVYMMAVALGLKNKLREPSKRSKEVRTYHGLKEKYKLLLRIIVLVSTGYDYDLLREGGKVIKVVEEYANGGIVLLYDKITSGGTGFSVEEEIWSQVRDLAK